MYDAFLQEGEFLYETPFPKLTSGYTCSGACGPGLGTGGPGGLGGTGGGGGNGLTPANIGGIGGGPGGTGFGFGAVGPGILIGDVPAS